MSCVQSTLRNFGTFGQIRLSDKFGFRLNFGLRHALFLTPYRNQIRNFYYFFVKTWSHHDISHHQKHKQFFNILLSTQRKEIIKQIAICSLERRWIAKGAGIDLSGITIWNDVDSHWPVRVDWAGGLFVRAQSLRLCQMSKCHFTIIMSCVQSTLRNFGTFGQIRLSDKFGFRHFGLRHALFLKLYLNQIRNFYYFFVKTWSHHNISHHEKHKQFFKISFLALRGKKYLQNRSRPAA